MSRPTKEYTAFTALTDRLLAVPRETLDRRLAEYRKQASQRGVRPGPKSKAKPITQRVSRASGGRGRS
jgi:hypothetical protein